MNAPDALAFVDLETTGLGPGTHRIAEIGVVTLDAGGVQEWSSLVNPGRLADGQRAIEGVPVEETEAAPRFAEIAEDLARRLQGRLLIAHNARFDYAFLKAEFARAGVQFDAPALCTVMLSRKLYPEEQSHHLDALMERHGLSADVRHRALPDARLLHEFWQVVTRDFTKRRLSYAIDKLLAEPLLPPHLDAGLVQALPEKPGVYVLRGENRRALRIARASNLRRAVHEYFRLDRISAKGAKLSYDVRTIDWQVAEGELSARLAELALIEKEPGFQSREAFSIRVDPASRGAVAGVFPAAELAARGETLFGLFDSARKAGNALSKLALRGGLCTALLGMDRAECTECRSDRSVCEQARPQHLVRALTALTPLRLQPWPYAGSVGVREGLTVHVFDQWQWIGSARTASEVADLATLRPNGFNPALFTLLAKALPRFPRRRLKTLRPAARPKDDPDRAV